MSRAPWIIWMHCGFYCKWNGKHWRIYTEMKWPDLLTSSRDHQRLWAKAEAKRPSKKGTEQETVVGSTAVAAQRAHGPLHRQHQELRRQPPREAPPAPTATQVQVPVTNPLLIHVTGRGRQDETVHTDIRPRDSTSDHILTHTVR